jgi:hypothetical protein
MGYHVDTSWIIRLPLAPTGRWVLVCMNDMGWPCWPSIDKLSKLTGVPRRSLERVLGMLRKGGYLKASGNGKSLTWELVDPPAARAETPDNRKRTMRHRGGDQRHRGASGAPPWRTTCATMAHGSEPENEPEKEPGVRRLIERPATPPEQDPPGTQYVNLGAAYFARKPAEEASEPDSPLSLLEALRQIQGAGVPPPAGDGRVTGGPDVQSAQARLAELRRGRLHA